MPPRNATTIEVWTAFFTAAQSSRPMALAMTTFAPKAIPTNRLTIRAIIELFAPTAATAPVFPAPVKLPTTAISDALNSCSRMAVAATGNANSGSLFQMEPCSISSCRFSFSVSMFRCFFLLLYFKNSILLSLNNSKYLYRIAYHS